MEVDKTTQNDELEANANDYDNSDTEGDEASSETQEQSGGDDDRTYTAAELEERIKEARKEQDRRWKDRIKGLEGKEGSQESGEKADRKESVSSNDEVTIARLEARGVTDPDIQDYLMSVARREDKHPVDLLNDDYIKGRIDTMKKEKQQKDATPDPSRRTGSTDRSKDVNYWVEQARQGKSAPDAEMRRQVRKRLAGR